MKLKNANRIIYRLTSASFTSPNIRQYSTKPPERRTASYDARLEKLLNSAPKLDGRYDPSEWHMVRSEIHELILSQPLYDRRKPTAKQRDFISAAAGEDGASRKFSKWKALVKTLGLANASH